MDVKVSALRFRQRAIVAAVNLHNLAKTGEGSISATHCEIR